MRDGGVGCTVLATWLDAGVDVGYGDAGALPWEDLLGAACLTSTELSSHSCFTAQAEVVVSYPDLDAGFEYGTGMALRPSEAFESATRELFESCAPHFRAWDGGSYPYLY